MSQPIRVDEDICGVTDLRESLPRVVDKVSETKRPTIITRRNRPVAAIVEIGVLQQMYDRLARLEELEDRQVVLEFEALEARGEVTWLSHEEMAEKVGRIVSEVRGG